MLLAYGCLETLAPGDEAVPALDGRKAMVFKDWAVPTPFWLGDGSFLGVGGNVDEGRETGGELAPLESLQFLTCM